MDDQDYFILNSEFTDPKRLKKEREKAKALKQSSWWHTKIQQGACHYCEKIFQPKELTMDHVVPLARGGTSTKGNLVPACKNCNRDKKLSVPAERMMQGKPSRF